MDQETYDRICQTITRITREALVNNINNRITQELATGLLVNIKSALEPQLFELIKPVETQEQGDDAAEPEGEESEWHQ